MSGEKNHQYGLKGSKNATWKHDIKLSRYGYVMVRSLEHPFRQKDDFVFEHRLIAEKYLLNDENSIDVDGKKYLKEDYVVHHKNFDKTDNRVENLQVMTKREHQSLHAKLNPREIDELGRFRKDENMEIKIKRTTETAILPFKGSKDAAGYDLFVDSDSEITINPHETKMLQTNVAFAIPKGYFGAVFARSGLSTRNGLRPATCVSVIDSDYRGSVGVPLHNDFDEAKTIQPHERVAQMVIMQAPEIEYVEVGSIDELGKTDRGNGGFGSSGK